MTTRDPNTLELPQEARIPSGNAPSPSHTLNAPVQAPSPGTSGAALRSPTQPTVPEFDPTSLAVLLQKMGNEFVPQQLPQNPQNAASESLPHTLPTSDGPSPFQVNPSFAGALVPEPLFTIPLFDAPEAPREQHAPQQAELPTSQSAHSVHATSVPSFAQDARPAEPTAPATIVADVPTSHRLFEVQDTRPSPQPSPEFGRGGAGFDANLIEKLAPERVIPGHGAVFDDVGKALAVARQRLEKLMRDPAKHARHAIKVLMKFKLLEVQTISTAGWNAWLHGTPYLEAIRSRFFSDVELGRLTGDILAELVSAGAAEVGRTDIRNR